MPLNKNKILDDIEDEAEAIGTYEQRKKSSSKLRPMYSEMQGDEKNHMKKLTGALAGLKGLKIKEKEDDD